MLVNNKEKIDQPQRSGVYERNCKEKNYDAVYTVKSGKAIIKRLKLYKYPNINK